MMNEKIKNSDPEELEKIAKKIASYSDKLKKDMKKLLSTHSGIHSDWSGKQYDDFSKVIESTNSTVCKQADKLEKISNEVLSYAKDLRAANEKKMGLKNV